MMNDNQIETEIQAKGLTAPRITPDDIEANIEIAYYFTGEEALQFAGQNGSPFVAHRSMGLLTFCVLILRNGFTVTGEAACASPENFNAETGKKIARENATNKIWPLMGYELKCRLAREAVEQQEG